MATSEQRLHRKQPKQHLHHERADGVATSVSVGVASFGPILKSGRMSTAEFVAAVKRLDFEAVELCDRTVPPERRKEALEILEAAGMSCPSFAIRNDFSDESLDQEVEFARARSGLQTAAYLGARTVRVWTGSTSSSTWARSHVTRALLALADEALASDQVLAVETHGGLSNQPLFVSSLLDSSNGGLTVCLDWGNLPAEKRDTLVSSFIPMTGHVHLKTLSFDSEGEEVGLGARRYVDALIASGYRGRWVVEYEGEPPFQSGVERTRELLVEAVSGERD